MKVRDISRDSTLRVRAEEWYRDVIVQYVAAIGAGETIAPLMVFHDGSKHWLADGYCRVAAAIEAGLTKVDVEVRMGIKQDALKYAFRRELPPARTVEDKRRDVEDRLERVPRAIN
jgi:hypothetical protein